MGNLRRIECEGGHYKAAPTADISDSAVIGPDTTLWDDVRVGAGSFIGEGCVIGAGVHIESSAQLGDYCKVQRGVTIYSGVVAGDYVFFGPNATTTNDRNPRAFGAWEKSQTLIETGASIGANATVIAGNRVGALSLVGAGAVVTRDVGPCQLVVGNPARFNGWVNVAGEVTGRDQDVTPSEVELVIHNPRLAIEQYLIQEEL